MMKAMKLPLTFLGGSVNTEINDNIDDTYQEPNLINDPNSPITPPTYTYNPHSEEDEEATTSSIKNSKKGFDHVPVRGFKKLTDIYQNTQEVETNTLLVTEEEPQNYKEASTDKKWIEAMEIELDSINKNNTWSLTTLPPNQKEIGLKWVFKTKKDAEGKIIKYKARLVAKGYVQEQGIDFDEEEVYVTQPEGFVQQGNTGKVYKLIKALYGLRQAPRAWNVKLDQTLRSLDFKKCNLEQAVYTRRSKTSTLTVGVYTGGEITIKQTGYINKILKETSMMDSNETKIPMDPGTKLVKAEDGNPVDATYYRSLIGSLRYLLHTGPDFSYSVGLLSRFIQDPKDHHLKANSWRLLEQHVKPYAIALVRNPVFHGRSKHIDIRYHFIRECVENGHINVEHISEELQREDILTKALPRLKNNVKEKVTKDVSSKEQTFPPGFTSTSINDKARDEFLNSHQQKSFSHGNSDGMLVEQRGNSRPIKIKSGGSILEVMEDLVKIRQTMGILCIWDSRKFVKYNVTISDSFLAIRSTLVSSSTKLLIVSVYAPQDFSERKILWDYIAHMIQSWEGECVILRDFNEVRFEYHIFGTYFNDSSANAFNHFILSAGLIDLALEDGFDKIIEDAWKNSGIMETKIALLTMKLQALKSLIKTWCKEDKKNSNEYRFSMQSRLTELDKLFDKGKTKAMVFKADFEKAFDSVRWDYLDGILSNFDFGAKWRGWIQSCLNLEMGSIIVNGSPSSEYSFHKGLKQGDPLSPFLFILANAISLVHTLNCFSMASGLMINIIKSTIMGIGTTKEEVNSAANIIGCSTLSSPFKYLGVKVGSSSS
nr:ribonuclease H-like domain, reverse transcriptase, RNA-dependent DNA polymerase [Tanacetum cinerariifolium]